jgi:hypothetical protein
MLDSDENGVPPDCSDRHSTCTIPPVAGPSRGLSAADYCSAVCLAAGSAGLSIRDNNVYTCVPDWEEFVDSVIAAVVVAVVVAENIANNNHHQNQLPVSWQPQPQEPTNYLLHRRACVMLLLVLLILGIHDDQDAIRLYGYCCIRGMLCSITHCTEISLSRLVETITNTAVSQSNGTVLYAVVYV